MRWLAAVLVLLAACSRGTTIQVIQPQDLPDDLYAAPTPGPTAAPERDVRIYLTRGGRLVGVLRTPDAAGATLEFAVRSLIAGPMPDEAAQGVDTAIPDAVDLLAVTATESVAMVNLTERFEQAATPDRLLLRIAQVVFTVTEDPRVNRVVFSIEGNPVNVVGEDGVPRTEPVGRKDYASLGPG